LDFLSFLSALAIGIFLVSALPQIGKLVRHKTARDISLWMSVLIALGNILMVVRSISVNDPFFLLNYTVQALLWILIVFLVIHYRKRK
jgi:uncharacterized protein with PQ loop repeat